MPPTRLIAGGAGQEVLQFEPSAMQTTAHRPDGDLEDLSDFRIVQPLQITQSDHLPTLLIHRRQRSVETLMILIAFSDFPWVGIRRTHDARGHEVEAIADIR